jgi:hypothetical protein
LNWLPLLTFLEISFFRLLLPAFFFRLEKSKKKRKASLSFYEDERETKKKEKAKTPDWTDHNVMLEKWEYLKEPSNGNGLLCNG